MEPSGATRSNEAGTVDRSSRCGEHVGQPFGGGVVATIDAVAQPGFVADRGQQLSCSCRRAVVAFVGQFLERRDVAAISQHVDERCGGLPVRRGQRAKRRHVAIGCEAAHLAVEQDSCAADSSPRSARMRSSSRWSRLSSRLASESAATASPPSANPRSSPNRPWTLNPLASMGRAHGSDRALAGRAELLDPSLHGEQGQPPTSCWAWEVDRDRPVFG